MGNQRVTMIASAIIILAFLIANTLYAYLRGSEVLQDSRSVAHSNLVISHAALVASMAQEAESSQRGYVITNNPDYLGRYRSLQTILKQQLAQLASETDDNPNQQKEIAILTKLIGEKFVEMQAVLDGLGSGGFEAARQRILQNVGKRLMDDIRATTTRIIDAESNLLVQRRAATTNSARVAGVSLWVGTLLAIAILMLAFYALGRVLNTQAAAITAENRHRVALEEQIAIKESLESERETLISELQRSNRELQDFAFVASHDLQEPLRKIQAFGDRLRVKSADTLNDDSKAYLATMLGAAARMQTLINDLLMLSRVTSKAQPFSVVNMDRIAREVIEDLQTRIEDTGATIEAQPLGTLKADPLQMRQLLQNLLSNALKFARPGVPPVLKVSPISVGNRRGFTVKDNGIGFEQRHAEKIFTVFQRLHGRGEYEGTGVGLAICRKIVERHLGTIEATSAPGEGATFTVLFPKQIYEKV